MKTTQEQIEEFRSGLPGNKLEGVKAIYTGKTNLGKYFLSEGEGGAIVEHIQYQAGIRRSTHTSEEPLYNLIKQHLEELLHPKPEEKK